jgi:hypothetical protein
VPSSNRPAAARVRTPVLIDWPPPPLSSGPSLINFVCSRYRTVFQLAVAYRGSGALHLCVTRANFGRGAGPPTTIGERVTRELAPPVCVCLMRPAGHLFVPSARCCCCCCGSRVVSAVGSRSLALPARSSSSSSPPPATFVQTLRADLWARDYEMAHSCHVSIVHARFVTPPPGNQILIKGRLRPVCYAAAAAGFERPLARGRLSGICSRPVGVAGGVTRKRAIGGLLSQPAACHWRSQPGGG